LVRLGERHRDLIEFGRAVIQVVRRIIPLPPRKRSSRPRGARPPAMPDVWCGSVPTAQDDAEGLAARGRSHASASSCTGKEIPEQDRRTARNRRRLVSSFLFNDYGEPITFTDADAPLGARWESIGSPTGEGDPRASSKPVAGGDRDGRACPHETCVGTQRFLCSFATGHVLSGSDGARGMRVKRASPQVVLPLGHGSVRPGMPEFACTVRVQLSGLGFRRRESEFVVLRARARARRTCISRVDCRSRALRRATKSRPDAERSESWR